MKKYEVNLICCKCKCLVNIYPVKKRTVIAELQNVLKNGCPYCGKSPDSNWLLEKIEEVKFGDE